MKFSGAFLTTALLCLATLHAAEVAQPANPAPKTTAELVAELASEDYHTREEATLALWKLGFTAMDELKQAAQSDDPEVAFRAQKVLRKIQLLITPDTDPEVEKLAEEYATARPARKIGILQAMTQMRALGQVLRLFAAETDPSVRIEMESDRSFNIHNIALYAAREKIVGGDTEGARTLLELAPANASGLLALAEFFRAQGTLGAELEKAKTSTAKGKDAWLFALYRASGDLESALRQAGQVEEPTLGATLAALHGDPVPLLELQMRNSDIQDNSRTYLKLAIQRWTQGSLSDEDLLPLTRQIQGNENWVEDGTAQALYQLARPDLVLSELRIKRPAIAAEYYISKEDIPEALKCLGIDPDQPDLVSALQDAYKKYQSREQFEQADSGDLYQLDILLSLMATHGLSGEIAQALDPIMEKIASGEDGEILKEISYFHDRGLLSYDRKLTMDWAGDDAQRWKECYTVILGNEPQWDDILDWMATVAPESSAADRYDGIMSLQSGISYDVPEAANCRELWMGRFWKAIGDTPEPRRQKLLDNITFLILKKPVLGEVLRLMDQEPAVFDRSPIESFRPSILIMANRWQELADFYLEQIQTDEGKLNPIMHAYAASALRRVGKDQEAAEQDQWVDRLALGQNTGIARAYDDLGDYTHSKVWWDRAAMECSDNLIEVRLVFTSLLDTVTDTGDWKRAAALAEFIASQSTAYLAITNTENLSYRLRADVYKALDLLPTDREKALKMLDDCHKLMPTAGSLADYFFPAIRAAGLTQESDAWFEESWKRFAPIIKKYPNAHNSLNTIGWMAARAKSHLDEAEQLENQSLANAPENPAYMDTMAEIQFAKGDRKAAVEWSAKSNQFILGENFQGSIGYTDIRRQYYRFLEGPFPK
ncbi:hypothetical protein JIN85_06325 [Luteolibacter pohnpeiensis]|uniref:Tetratricopeptide repeat protein n=1 Tax=Luteolibacter pohnpeiensis TaxID=454153 RepID=A0A934VU03_9BACT|nr:hypothetical protein [Luteolibacter pohnpeiensis]MBK1882022.1 hypothetical protein [Luteolibacter pohnpeiensis]